MHFICRYMSYIDKCVNIQKIDIYKKIPLSLSLSLFEEILKYFSCA